MNKTVILLLMLMVVMLNCFSQSPSISFEYNTNSEMNLFKKRNHYADFFVDSTIYKRKYVADIVYVDTFKIINEDWQIYKNGKWYDFVSINPKKKLLYPMYVVLGTTVYWENTVTKIFNYNGRKLIYFNRKEVGIESSEPMDDVILFDLDLGVIKLTGNGRFERLSEIKYIFK